VEGEEWLQEWWRHAISIWQGTGGSVDHGIDHGIAFGFFGFLGGLQRGLCWRGRFLCSVCYLLLGMYCSGLFGHLLLGS
jgi:hypothetical protein